MKGVDGKKAPAGRGKAVSLRRRVEELATRLAEAEETISAIRSGAVDALLVDTPQGQRIYTLNGADRAYRVFLEAMGEGALTVTREGLVIHANRRFAEIAGATLEKVIGESLLSFAAPESRRPLEALLLTGTPEGSRGEISLCRFGGTAVPVAVSIAPLPESDPPALCLVVTELAERKKREAELTRYRERLEELVKERTSQLETANAQLRAEIVERAQADEALKVALAEKDLLMRELAHRTKNNMQVIGSLLALQAAGLDDKKALHALADTQDRIRVMALVHETLYRSGNITSLDIKEYVQNLVGSVLGIHRVAGASIQCSLEVDKILLPIDAALPCGLIINELVSNSLKHAFPAGKSGHIFLSLRRVGDNVELKYRDDGPGLPRGLDLKKMNSLGLKLVYNLAVRQLRGTMEIRHDPVSEFVFVFCGLPQAAPA